MRDSNSLVMNVGYPRVRNERLTTSPIVWIPSPAAPTMKMDKSCIPLLALLVISLEG
jgi:hypothetical protein